jgi:hypothetical protein
MYLQNQMLLDQLFDLKSKVIMISFYYLLSLVFVAFILKHCNSVVTIMFGRSKNYRTLTRTSGKR